MIELKQANEWFIGFIKKVKLPSMFEGKNILMRLVFDWEETSLNDLLISLNYPKIYFGDKYGWNCLGHDLLSNKYGVYAYRPNGANKTNFGLRLPPLEKLDSRPPKWV